MKREFLQNLKVGDQALPKEIVDAIMDENGKDIEAAKKPFADYEAIKERLKTAEDGLKAFDGVDVEEFRSSHILDFTQDAHKFHDVVAVCRTEIADVQPFKDVLLVGKK